MYCSIPRRSTEKRREWNRCEIWISVSKENLAHPDWNGFLASCYYYVYYLYIFGEKRRRFYGRKWAINSHCSDASTKQFKSPLFTNSTILVLNIFSKCTPSSSFCIRFLYAYTNTFNGFMNWMMQNITQKMPTHCGKEPSFLRELLYHWSV